MEQETDFTAQLRAEGFEPMEGWHVEREQAAKKASKQSVETLITSRMMKPSEKEPARKLFRVWRRISQVKEVSQCRKSEAKAFQHYLFQ